MSLLTEHSQKKDSDHSISTLYTLTSVCMFSTVFPIHFSRCWQGEIPKKNKSFFGMWSLYSRKEKFTGIDQSSERASAILHIISTTRSCACAQFTRLKTKNACKWSQYRPFSAESVRVWRVGNTLQKPTVRKKLMCSLKVKIPSLINCPLSPPPQPPPSLFDGRIRNEMCLTPNEIVQDLDKIPECHVYTYSLRYVAVKSSWNFLSNYYRPIEYIYVYLFHFFPYLRLLCSLFHLF